MKEEINQPYDPVYAIPIAAAKFGCGINPADFPMSPLTFSPEPPL
jgi:hypothetical protein